MITRSSLCIVILVSVLLGVLGRNFHTAGTQVGKETTTIGPVKKSRLTSPTTKPPKHGNEHQLLKTTTTEEPPKPKPTMASKKQATTTTTKRPDIKTKPAKTTKTKRPDIKTEATGEIDSGSSQTRARAIAPVSVSPTSDDPFSLSPPKPKPTKAPTKQATTTTTKRPDIKTKPAKTSKTERPNIKTEPTTTTTTKRPDMKSEPTTTTETKQPDIKTEPTTTTTTKRPDMKSEPATTTETKQPDIETEPTTTTKTKQPDIETEPATTTKTKQPHIKTKPATTTTTKRPDIKTEPTTATKTKRPDIETESATTTTTKRPDIETESATTTTTKRPDIETESATTTTTKRPDIKTEATGEIDSGSSQMRARAIAPVSVSPTSDDPFSLSPEWILFNRRMDNLTVILLERMKPVYSIFTDKNEEYKANRTGFLDDFTKRFNEKYLQRLIDLLIPVQDELDRNEAFTIVNPAINLRKIGDAIRFAKTDPTQDDDKGRLKWMEVNSMAATVHHVYKRIIPNIEKGGLEEVNRAIAIVYPSWVTNFVIKENENNFQDLDIVNLTAYIHEQMNTLGEPNHLIRILERLLNKMPLNDWDPSKTSLNMYCFGNSRYGHIHRKFDVLLDAALYLCLADMKFAILEMTNNVYISLKAEQGNGTKFDLESKREEIETRLKTRLERKYRIAPELGTINIDTPIAPKRFQCDHPPKDCGESPHATSPYCPPGIYIQDGKLYNNGTKIQLPENPSDGVTVDGKQIECIGLEFVPFDKNGAIIPCYLKERKCVDSETGNVIEDLNVVLTPVLLDENRVPLRRDNSIPSYPKSSQWGIMDCEIHPDPPSLDPPQGGFGQKKGSEDDKTRESRNNTGGEIPKLGYLDPRKPNTTESAQFFNAFPGYLESELVLNAEGKCIGTCKNYRNPTPTCTNKTGHCSLYRKSHCVEPSSDCMRISNCPNKAKRCIRTSREVNYCPAPENSRRLYDWMKFNNKIRAGRGVDPASIEDTNPTCNGTGVIKIQERWEMESSVILNTPQYCEICLCVCTDPFSSEGQHYFDISPRLADTSNSFVVTGLRFEQKNNTMSLNIQQGKLLENGKIDESTITWLEPNLSPQPIPLGSAGFLKMNLDEIHAKFTEVVTGIRWSQNGDSLNLEIGVTEFISEVPTSSSKIDYISSKTQNKRQRFDLSESDSPYNQGGPSQPYPITDNSKFYIEFDASSLEKDGGQSVVPFFDLQPILSSNKIPVPLSAVGILYKSKEGSGGFLAPSLRTFVHPYMREFL